MITPLSRQFIRKHVRHTLLGLTALGSMGLALSLQAQSDNFNGSSLSPYWYHYDVGDIGKVYGVPGLATSYTLVPDGTGGHGLRIHSPPDAPYDGAPYGFGPARALAFRVDAAYATRFSVGVDIIAWNNTIDQAFGPFWFIQTSPSPGPGTTDGYVMTWEATGNQLRISRTTSEQPTTIASTPNVVLDPSQRYRLLISSHDGSTFLGQVFSTTNLINPLAAIIGMDSTYQGGWMGLLGYDGTSPSVAGADVTYDNYNGTIPSAGTMRTTVAYTSPAPGERASAIIPTVTAAILDRDTQVDPNSVLFWMDGTAVPAGSLNIVSSVNQANNPGAFPHVFGGATVSYPLPSMPAWGSLHTNTISFVDSQSILQTYTWTWTAAYPLLHATNSLPLGSLSFPGWNVRMVYTNGPTLGSSLARAEQQLANPPQIPYLLTTQIVSQVLNWNDSGDGVNASPFGYFYDPTLVSGVPGLPPDNSHDNIACECFAYLQLTAGLHRFGAVSDDGFQLRSGHGLLDLDATVLGVKDGGTFNGTFDFVVEADGLYPVRCLWYENGGYANFQLFSVDVNDPNTRVLLNDVNDPNAPEPAVPAFLPIRLLAASAVTGPYATATSAVIDLVAQTVTVPMAGPAQFYRLQMANPVRLTSITPVGANLVIHYQ